MIFVTLSQIRAQHKMSQETLAEQIGVSRQAIQKWESGESQPTISNLIMLSKIFGVSLDYLCGNVITAEDVARMGFEILPSYDAQPTWESYSKAFSTEYRQSFEEGKDIQQYESLFNAVSQMSEGKYKEKMTDLLFNIAMEAPIRKDFPYFEPNSIDTIKQQRVADDIKLRTPSNDEIKDKIFGGWYGRICGCLLGKPVEGIKIEELTKILKRIGNYPLKRYIDKEDITEDMVADIHFPIANRAYPKGFGRMPPDDDTNYMIMGYEVVNKYGYDFHPEDVAQTWLRTQVKDAYCTAERVAYRNFLNGFLPPASAEYKNPYREWIGAQIRGDFYGYINPGQPEAAADMAFRDACISHTKNGIYGEMWISAMIAAAFCCDSAKEIVCRGLAEIPHNSRLHEAVSNIVEMYTSSIPVESCFHSIHERWNEHSGHDWCHTISNAEIVVASLLYGEGDYGHSICLAVSQGFDTDCNGATVGSIIGVKNGSEALPAEWTDRVYDTLESEITGYTKVSIKEMAEKTFALLNAKQRLT